MSYILDRKITTNLTKNRYIQDDVFTLYPYHMRKTLENLTKAFVGESQARNRYTIYASIARKEGYLQIADIFLMTAEQEKEHAERFFKMIQMVKEKLGEDMDEVKIETSAFVKRGTTLQNLQYAIDGEHHENSELYPEFARIADEEGLPEIAARIRAISHAEEHHEGRYQALVERLNDGTLRAKAEEVERVCSKCGYIHKGKTPPERCPSCDHEKNFYQVNCEKY